VDPPLLDDGPESPPMADAYYNLWMLHLEDVVVEHVREVWINTLRSQGDTRVRGRWLFQPQRWLDVGPATVDVGGVEISRAGHPLATGLNGSFRATVSPFGVREVKGGAILDYVSFHGGFGGHALIGHVLDLLVRSRDVDFKRCEGPLDAHVDLDHGTLVGATRVQILGTDCRIEARGLAFAAPILMSLAVDGNLATVDTTVSDLCVSRLGVELARVASVAATVTSRRLQVASIFGDAGFSLDVGGVVTQDVGAWTHFVPSSSKLLIVSGKVMADGHAEGSLADKRGRALLRIVARRLTLARGNDRFTSDVTSDFQAREVSLPNEVVVGDATIRMDDAEVRLDRVRIAGKLAANVELRRGAWAKGTFDLSGSDIKIRGATASSTRSDANVLVVPAVSLIAPRLVVVSSGVDGQISLDLPHADLLDLGRLHELVQLPNGLVIRGGRGSAKLHAEIDLASRAVRGDAVVVARAVRARVAKTELYGDLSCTLRARARRDGAMDLSGSALAIRHAGAGDAAKVGDGWWGDLSLRSATVQTRMGARFDAMMHLRAQDAKPATVLVSQNTGVPAWAANVFRMPDLNVDAEVGIGASWYEVRSLFARAGSTSVRAEYSKRDGRQDGAVLMDLGWIELGYDLSQASKGLVIVGPEGWYGRKTAILRNSAGAARRKTDAAEQVARYSAMSPAARANEARALAAHCTPEARTCDGASIENLLRAAVAPDERDTLSGIVYSPMVVAVAKGGKDGTTLDPLVMGSLAEAFRVGGKSTLDNIPSVARLVAASDSNAARGKVIAVSGHASAIRRDGPYSVGTILTDAEPIYFVTLFTVHADAGSIARFRGVFVQRYTSPSLPPALVLVGAFDREPPSGTSAASVVQSQSAAPILTGLGNHP
jgi:hypothetical protein